MNANLEYKLAILKDAEQDVIEELERLYPEGKTVGVYLAYNQKHPSDATVIGHDGGIYGYVRVRLHSGKKMVRSVTPGNISE